jgi:hypothetical protein
MPPTPLSELITETRVGRSHIVPALYVTFIGAADSLPEGNRSIINP